MFDSKTVALSVSILLLSVAGASAFDSVSKDEVDRVPPGGAEIEHGVAVLETPQAERTDWITVEFNTGGTWNQVPDLSGSASGWGYYTLHSYHYAAGPELWLLDLYFPTNAYTADPISMPVEWVLDIGNGDVFSIVDPYTHSWHEVGVFTPEGADDTTPPDTYTHVELPHTTFLLQAGESMVWGYENAGLMGMTDYSGEVTYSWYFGAWDADVGYGRTALMQFRGEFWLMVPAKESSLSEIKSLF